VKYTDEKGKFKKGNPGRQHGSVGKKTKQWDEIGDYLINEGANKFIDILRKQDDQKFIQYYTTILEYFKPKQVRSDNFNRSEGKLQIEITYGDDNDKD